MGGLLAYVACQYFFSLSLSRSLSLLIYLSVQLSHSLSSLYLYSIEIYLATVLCLLTLTLCLLYFIYSLWPFLTVFLIVDLSRSLTLSQWELSSPPSMVHSLSTFSRSNFYSIYYLLSICNRIRCYSICKLHFIRSNSTLDNHWLLCGFHKTKLC